MLKDNKLLIIDENIKSHESEIEKCLKGRDWKETFVFCYIQSQKELMAYYV